MITYEFLQNLKNIPRIERRKIFLVLKLFKKLDKDISAFQNVSKMKCLEGCGKCCENPNIEVTMLDMMPLALSFLKERGTIDGMPSEGVCQFYVSDPLVAHNGRCSVYPLRPITCRLFGFAARMSKHRKPELVTCRRIKETFGKDVKRTQEWIDQGLEVPLMTKYSAEAYDIDPQLATQYYPINKAFKLALEKMSLILRYREK